MVKKSGKMFIEICVGVIVLLEVGQFLLKTVDTTILGSILRSVSSESDEEQQELTEEMRCKLYS